MSVVQRVIILNKPFKIRGYTIVQWIILAGTLAVAFLVGSKVPPDWKIPECVRLMHQKDIRHVPVMRGNEVIGVLSVRDFMGALIERHERLLRRFDEERLTLLYPDPSSY